jgi:hypothetical protein
MPWGTEPSLIGELLLAETSRQSVATQQLAKALQRAHTHSCLPLLHADLTPQPIRVRQSIAAAR